LGLVRTADDLDRAFVADNLWGAAAGLWLVTGLVRVFGGVEKGAFYYLHDRAFIAKMGLFIIILLLEIRPMVTLIRWRIGLRRGNSLSLESAPALARITWVQACLVVLMVFAATAVARGFFY